jgi:cytochrome c5
MNCELEPVIQRPMRTAPAIPGAISVAIAIGLSVAAHPAAAQPHDRSGKDVVTTVCSACHAEGINGAPKIGDRAAWIPRLKQGFDVLVRSAINGHGGMPPRGGVVNLMDTEIRGAIAYMLNPEGTHDVAALPAKAADPNHRTIAGTEVYFGVTSVVALRQQPGTSGAQSKMHGDIPGGGDYYHVNVSLFDSQTKAPITDAFVEAKIVDPIRGDRVKVLEPMVVNGTTSYGNYLQLPGAAPYTIAVLIRKPGAGMIETKFAFVK